MESASTSAARKNSHNQTRRPLKRMFDAVPERYDLLNRTLTMRLDESWRRRAAAICLERSPSAVLDLCCGTGDLALHVSRGAAATVEVVGLDYSPSMLEIAYRKFKRAGIDPIPRVVEGDAACMDFPDDCFDVVGIAFGFRNITWKNPIKDKALSEVRRVLRPGGRFVIVETSQPENRLLRAGFHSYLKVAVSLVGAELSGNKGAYRYLAESARRFYDANEVSSMLADAGLPTQRVERLLGGAAAIHVAEKPDAIQTE